MGERKVFRFPIVLTEHVFDKVRAIDVTLAEFEELLQTGEIIEERLLIFGAGADAVQPVRQR